MQQPQPTGQLDQQFNTIRLQTEEKEKTTLSMRIHH
jgi:hypothetical protein